MRPPADIGPEISKKCVEFYCKETTITVEAAEKKLAELKYKKCCGRGCTTCIKTVWARFETHIKTLKESEP